MHLRKLLIAVVSISGSSPSALVQAVQVQKAGLTKAAVKKIFTDTYSAYREYAFGHDELTPESKSFSDSLGGWGASMVDAMDTMLIMGIEDWFLEAVNKTAGIDFNTTTTDSTISVFETTIRYVGGLLAAYELSDQKYPVLVQKAQEVANKLVFAFTGSSPIPFGHLNFTTNTPGTESTSVAGAGTLSLEWDRLTHYTGNTTYQNLAVAAVEHIASLPDPLPGLPAQGIDASTGEFVGAYVTWGGGTDSYLEYLIKYPRLTNDHDDLATVWATAVDSSIRTLLSTSTVGNWTYLADLTDDAEIRVIGSHLACFHGGNWLMGGQMLNNQTIVDIALELVDACWNTYAATATGIGPEAFAWISPQTNFSGATPSADDLAFYQEHGFYIYPGDGFWVQRPEVMESNFYAYRVTGDTKYLDRAASVVESFQQFTRASQTGAYAPINDVNSNTTTLMDDTQSFFYAEVLKYLYLTFDDPDHISLNDFVFNTEAHPFKAPPAKATYGTGKLNPPNNTGGSRTKAQPANLAQISEVPIAPKQIADLYKGF
ncbi:glycoside hydrolase family 47 protein [Punctularia strigosozonata HHB-11173 SS5]|uniref:glycoside hydrolase family 47 protein n=1 Tax=Punctularia strigosozonata (strain HHB-11173) TaxID=741275 RepID=UPI00044167D2|nr:glycoside hydrolase family 47 protein [Punctularia strigosozonata HHB-11173 SS5]EIN11296.1 glycoside hydrolase family 47 protein [Punctularia strigosozonata HHB-11173 SS5]